MDIISLYIRKRFNLVYTGAPRLFQYTFVAFKNPLRCLHCNKTVQQLYVYKYIPKSWNINDLIKAIRFRLQQLKPCLLFWDFRSFYFLHFIFSSVCAGKLLTPTIFLILWLFGGRMIIFFFFFSEFLASVLIRSNIQIQLNFCYERTTACRPTEMPWETHGLMSY